MTLVDRPLIQYAIDEARAAGIKEFIFVTSRGKGALGDYFDHAPTLEQELRKKGKDELLGFLKNHHVGVYAYRPAALMAYPTWGAGPLEGLEGLEQLRFLEHARPMMCVEVEARGAKFWELNNPEDVPLIEKMLRDMGQA